MEANEDNIKETAELRSIIREDIFMKEHYLGVPHRPLKGLSDKTISTYAISLDTAFKVRLWCNQQNVHSMSTVGCDGLIYSVPILIPIKQ